jgi:hypothetical protein
LVAEKERAAMRFYFNTRDGDDYLADDVGIDLVDLSSACREARLGARGMLAEMLLKEGAVDRPQLEITDTAGTVLQVITFRSAMSWNGLDDTTPVMLDGITSAALP